MGMDGVEIVMAVEEAFDIQIEDSEAEKIFTPRQLIDLVMSKIAIISTDICLTHRAFNLVRRALVRQTSLSRNQLKPETKLRSALPRAKRQAQLQQISSELAMNSLPQLVRPDWLKGLLIGVTAIMALAAAASPSYARIPGPAAAWLAILSVATIGPLALFLTKSCRTEFPKSVSTVGQFALWVMTHKANLALPEATAWTRDQVAARVRQIVLNTLACDSNYSEDARFIQDLGLG